MANICIAGLWHQAMVLGACFSDMNHTVWGVGDDEAVVAGLNRGTPPLFEPGIPAMLRRNVKAGRLRFTTDYQAALGDAEFVYISIDTPVNADDSSDLSSIFEAARNIARATVGRIILVITAQVPVGTCSLIEGVVREQNPTAQFDIAYVPEFLRLGTAVETFKRADRFVIGCDNPEVAEKIATLYRPLNRPILFTGLPSAEMGKHASNAFLANSISFINEISNLCEELGADASEVARIMKADKRIGSHAFLGPGLGFAGGTLGREIRALQKFGRENRSATPLMDAIWEVNQARPQIVRQRLEHNYTTLEGVKVGILGCLSSAKMSAFNGSAIVSALDRLRLCHKSFLTGSPIAVRRAG
ncbi:MAG: nucleotide sugar dehydrogenase, partial [Candidatus Binataceae bacterium]